MSVFQSLVSAWLAQKPVPLDIAFELTHRCNLDCCYCDRHQPADDELSTEEVLQFVSDFHALGTSGISFDGGEALMRKDLPEIVDHTKKLGIEVRLNSNGILIPKKLSLIKNVTKVKVSLDGTAEYHDSMRGKGSFMKAVEGVRAAKDAGVKVELTCVLHRENLNGVPQLLNLAAELRCGIIFQPVRNSLFNFRQRDATSWAPDEKEMQKAFRHLLHLRRKNKAITNAKASLRHFLNFPDDINIPCAAGWINCTVDPQGYLYHCGEIDRNAYKINLREHGVAKAFDLIPRYGCKQCWCARTVEENYLWGVRLHKFI